MSANATAAARAPIRPAASGPPHAAFTQLLMRVRSEFEEMPGLCLTRAQAQRLWGLDAETCDAVIAALVDAGYLKSSPTGYVRL